MQASAFSFTKLVVSDLARAERFYCGVFGMAVNHRITATDHAYALEEAMLAVPGDAAAHVLVLARYLRRPIPPAGAAWTGFVVPDLAASLAAAAELGGRIEVPTHENTEHGVLAALVADPEGHMIEIIQQLR